MPQHRDSAFRQQAIHNILWLRKECSVECGLHECYQHPLRRDTSDGTPPLVLWVVPCSALQRQQYLAAAQCWHCDKVQILSFLKTTKVAHKSERYFYLSHCFAWGLFSISHLLL